MDKSSKLIPNDIIAQCNAAISALQDNNDSLIKTLFDIDTFMMDTSIQSSAFDSMRMQIKNFFNIINMVRSANLADIDDYNSLKSMVGSEELDGAKLLEQLDEAKRQVAAFKAKMCDINSLISSTLENNTRQYARKQVQNYDHLIGLDQSMIDEIQKKIDFYDEVDSKSARLFTTGANIRKTALAMMGEMSKSTISGGRYSVPSNMQMANYLMGLSTTASAYCASTAYVSGDFNSIVPDHDVSIMTQNLRAVNLAKDGENNDYDARAPRVFNQVQKYDTDIVCFQECTKDWKSELSGMFGPLKYACVYGYNSAGLCNPIYVKRDKFKVLDSGTMQLNDVYELNGKKQESRVASWVKVKDKQTGKTMVIMNTHFDVKSKNVQVESAKLIKEKVAELNADDYIVTGDFNLDKDSNKEAYNIMTSNGSKNMAEASKTEGIQGRNEGTFHNFGKVPVQNRKQIDYFFGSDSLNSDFFSVVNDTYNNEYVSDHNGIVNYFSYK